MTFFQYSQIAAIPPTRGGSLNGSRPAGTQIYRTTSSNSASVILEGLPDNLSSFSIKPQPQYEVYHWGGGVGVPTKLTLPQHDSNVVQVSSGRTLKTGVTDSGRMIIWESNKKVANTSSEAGVNGRLLEDLWVPRFLEGQSGVTIIQVSCGDLFAACLTGRHATALDAESQQVIQFCCIRVLTFTLNWMKSNKSNGNYWQITNACNQRLSFSNLL